MLMTDPSPGAGPGTGSRSRFLHDRLDDRLVEELLQPRLGGPRSLGAPLGDRPAGAAAAEPFFGCWALGRRAGRRGLLRRWGCGFFRHGLSPFDRFAAALADATLRPSPSTLIRCARPCRNGCTPPAVEEASGSRCSMMPPCRSFWRRPLVLLHQLSSRPAPPGGRQAPRSTFPPLAALPGPAMTATVSPRRTCT